jgi:hypothetical protein
MSSGHDHPDWAGLSSQVIDRLLKNPEVTKNLWRVQNIDRDYDLPYLGGYSGNGETIYIDRHLPEELTYENDGQKKSFDPSRFVTMHERFEKAVMDIRPLMVTNAGVCLPQACFGSPITKFSSRLLRLTNTKP